MEAMRELLHHRPSPWPLPTLPRHLTFGADFSSDAIRGCETPATETCRRHHAKVCLYRLSMRCLWAYSQASMRDFAFVWLQMDWMDGRVSVGKGCEMLVIAVDRRRWRWIHHATCLLEMWFSVIAPIRSL